MINRPLILLAAGLLPLLGVVLFLQQHFSFTTDPGELARSEGNIPSSPAKFRHDRDNDAAAAQDILARLIRWRDGSADLDRETSHALADQLLQLDAEAAARFAESFPPGPLRDEALRRLAQGLAARDPERAERWALALPDATERSSAMADICLQIARTDAAKAIRKAELHQLDTGTSLTMESLVQQWAGQDLPAATAWILARPASGEREQMCSRLAIAQSATEPIEAAALVLKEIPEGHNQTEAIIAVLYQWASRDPEAAAAWVAAFPSGSIKERAENELRQLGSSR